MSNKFDDLLKMNDEILATCISLSEEKRKVTDSLNRTIDICKNSQQILNEIDSQFLEKTKLQKKDLPFLFFATALQTLRWILLPSLDLNYNQISKENRLVANEYKKSGPLAGKKSGQRYEKPKILSQLHNDEAKYRYEIEEYRKKINGRGEHQYQSWLEILMRPVPYDAMSGSEHIEIFSKNIIGRTTFHSPIGKQLIGKNHHVATLGHDPILGLLFGTMNIVSETITFCDLQTFPVIRGIQLDKWGQTIDYMNPSNIGEVISYCINSFMEDSKRLPAAVARQIIHMQSDKFTKDGLPIPLLSPDLAQGLIDKGWNSHEAENLMCKVVKNVKVISTQYMVAELINLLIRSVYLFLFPDDGIQFNKFKIEKILTISSCIAEGSNVAAVIAMRDISKLDIGGIISLVRQIAQNSKTQFEIKTEFLQQELNALVMEGSDE